MMKQLSMFVLMFVLMSSVALAEPRLVVVVNSPDSPSSIIDIAVLENNGFDETRLYEDHSPDSSTTEVVVEGLGGNVLSRKFLEGYSTQMAFVPGTSGVKIVSGISVLAEKKVSFCDNDKVCEPCIGASCSLIENSLTCTDCRSGSRDGFCDTVPDGICDTDCGFDLADADCERQCSQDCGLEEADLLSCDDMGGSVCGPEEDCMNGWMAYTWDSMYCCVGGVCAYPNEYVQTMVTLQNQPSMVITPSGEFASTVQDYGIGDYCVEKLGGSICDAPTEYCDGDLVEYYYNTYCCVGSCARYPESAFQSDDFMFAVRNETSRPLSEGEMFSLYDFSAMESQLESERDSFYPEEILQDLPEGEFPHEGIAEAATEPPVVSEQSISDAGASAAAAISKISDKIDLLQVALIALGALFFVAICLVLFTRSASKKVAAESARVDLQSEIDSLVSQGNDYKRVEQVLVSRGIDKSLVDSEIKKNYDKRVQLQKLSQQVGK